MTYRIEIPDDPYFRRMVKCQSACPVGTDARGYVRAIAAGAPEKAYLIARGPNPLASICGRVCGAPCEAACRRGSVDEPISIRALKRFATQQFGPESGRFEPVEIVERILERPDAGHAGEGEEELRALKSALELKGPLAPARGDAPRVAVVGGGPAGLACAHDLALMGIKAVVFETEEEPAGMLVYGIPEYRLPRHVVRAEVEVIRALGVEFRCRTRVGEAPVLDDLIRAHAAVVIAVGAKSSREIPLPGMEGPGVLGGIEFLREVALHRRPPDLGRHVVVIGGGNVAYDVARSAIGQIGIDVSRAALRQRQVASVTLACLEGPEEMPADEIEIRQGEEEGVQRVNSVGPVRVERGSDGRVIGVLFKRCTRVFDDRGRFAPAFDESQLTTIPADTVILAVGQTADLSFIDAGRDGIALVRPGVIRSDSATQKTSRDGVFVAGDIAHGPRLLIDAVASGKRAARQVYRYLRDREAVPQLRSAHAALPGYRREPGYEKRRRVPLPVLDPEERVRSRTAVVEKGYSAEQAEREASRCLDCGVNTIFDGSKCILCGGCVDVCPEGCLRIVSFEELATSEDLGTLRRALAAPGEPTSAILKDEDRCIRCALCALRCPTGAISMERFSFGPAAD